MYQWYKNATVCIVYLKDVTSRPSTRRDSKAYAEFAASSWFERGWTLQELLAPDIVVFCNADWEVIGHTHRRSTLLRDVYGSDITSEVSQITGIPESCLYGGSIRAASIAQRLGWASRRQTSRVEDEAYCLLGIFNINMPLIYGEGRMAFARLQEEIIKRSTDQSILAWEVHYSFAPTRSVLASSPRHFPRILDQESETVMQDHDHYTITNKGLLLRADLRVLTTYGRVLTIYGPTVDERFHYWYLYLNYCRNGTPARILVTKAAYSDLYLRVHENLIDAEDGWREGELLEKQLVYLATGNEV